MEKIVSQKQCSECKEWKPLIGFYKRKVGGFYGNCRDCHKRKTNAYRLEHPGLSNNCSLKWKKNNRTKHLDYCREYAKTNPGKRVALSRNRRARVKGSEGKITEKEWKELCKKYGNKCLRCGKTDAKLTLDHIVPLVKGGANTIENAQCLCKSCNSSKGVKTVDYRPAHRT